jgi:hypothetical protein
LNVDPVNERELPDEGDLPPTGWKPWWLGYALGPVLGGFFGANADVDGLNRLAGFLIGATIGTLAVLALLLIEWRRTR